MGPGEEFEIKCYEYLKKSYGTGSTSFFLENSMDSTKSDIAVIKNGFPSFYIEAKDTTAQSGQFVLLPDKDSRTFVFSPRNYSLPNEMTKIMIGHMNNNFDRYNNAGTAGESLDLDTSIFYDWVTDYYINKNVKYIMSYKDGYIILPIRKFSSYFKIQANFRVKKSGSGEPAKRDFPILKNTIQSIYPSASFYEQGEKLFSAINENIIKGRFLLEKYTYYFSHKNDNDYEIRRLSGTSNGNVIFSIQLKKPQDSLDLKEFEADL